MWNFFQPYCRLTGTISISQPPPDLDSLPAVAEDEDSESEQRRGNVNEVGERQDELAIS